MLLGCHLSQYLSPIFFSDNVPASNAIMIANGLSVIYQLYISTNISMFWTTHESSNFGNTRSQLLGHWLMSSVIFALQPALQQLCVTFCNSFATTLQPALVWMAWVLDKCQKQIVPGVLVAITQIRNIRTRMFFSSELLFHDTPNLIYRVNHLRSGGT